MRLLTRQDWIRQRDLTPVLHTERATASGLVLEPVRKGPTRTRPPWRPSRALVRPGREVPGGAERAEGIFTTSRRRNTLPRTPRFIMASTSGTDRLSSEPREQTAGNAIRAVRLVAVAYDSELADRIRFLIGATPGVTEKKMFGGLAFLVGGNMAISASGRGGALVRVDPADTDTLLATANATVAVMGGRPMPGWLRVSGEHLDTDEQLTEWVNRAVEYTRSLPPKR